MPRLTKHDYEEPGSFERILEAMYALWAVETDKRSDPEFHRALVRLRRSVDDRVRAVVGRLTRWQAKGGRARWLSTTPEERSQHARMMVAAREAKRSSKLDGQKLETVQEQSRP